MHGSRDKKLDQLNVFDVKLTWKVDLAGKLDDIKKEHNIQKPIVFIYCT